MSTPQQMRSHRRLGVGLSVIKQCLGVVPRSLLANATPSGIGYPSATAVAASVTSGILFAAVRRRGDNYRRPLSE